MSLHKSLKAKGALTRHRNVLTRSERFQTLAGDGKVTDDTSVYSLPKIRSIMAKAKAKVKAEAAATPAAGAAPAAPAAGAKAGAPAAGAKPAAPAAGAKAAAPAKK